MWFNTLFPEGQVFVKVMVWHSFKYPSLLYLNFPKWDAQEMPPGKTQVCALWRRRGSTSAGLDSQTPEWPAPTMQPAGWEQSQHKFSLSCEHRGNTAHALPRAPMKPPWVYQAISSTWNIPTLPWRMAGHFVCLYTSIYYFKNHLFFEGSAYLRKDSLGNKGVRSKVCGIRWVTQQDQVEGHRGSCRQGAKTLWLRPFPCFCVHHRPVLDGCWGQQAL